MKFLRALYHFFLSLFQKLLFDYRTQLKPRYGHGRSAHPLLLQLIEKQHDIYAGWMNKALPHLSPFQSLSLHPSPDQKNQKPYWINGFLPGLDIIMLYTMLVDLQPKKYVEIGSGNSTRVAHWAKSQAQLEMQIIAIDPEPRLEIESLTDTLYKVPLENFSMDRLPSLKSGDVVFVDNSHRILPNSDATVFFLEWLPRLPKGVVVQIHDVYWPYDYPDFMCRRLYSEQYGLAIALLSNPEKYKIIMPNYYVSQHVELYSEMHPFWNALDPGRQIERHGGSFWLTIQ